jgi:hypothetical protein
MDSLELKNFLIAKDPKKVMAFTPEKYFGAHQDPHAWESRYRAIVRNGRSLGEGIVQHPQFLDTYFLDGQVFLVKPGSIDFEAPVRRLRRKVL